jgi:hypothetical protein
MQAPRVGSSAFARSRLNPAPNWKEHPPRSPEKSNFTPVYDEALMQLELL